MPEVRVASFNLWGIEGREVQNSVAFAAQRMGPAVGNALAVGFQEVWYQHQLARVRDAWLGAGQFSSRRSGAVVWQSQSPGSWAVLVPDTPALSVPNFAFDNSSGLALCVQGRLSDAFYDRYRVAQVPDRFAYKGVLAALVVHQGVRRAFVTTHMNNADGDAAGNARAWQIEQLAGDLRWIDRNWNAPVILTGDFNIDAIRAINDASSVARVLYSRLLSAARAPNQWFWDVNARQQQPNPPVRTSHNGLEAIDLHLLDDRTRSQVVFAALDDQASDHFMVESSWVEP
jgi:hypothetical protein